MKRILLLGANSFIGTVLEARLSAQPDRFSVRTLSLHAPLNTLDFHGADAVVQLAAIVHCRETRKTRALAETVNRDLAVAAAKKAKAEGVGQFVLFSTVGVYGMTTGTITRDTVPHPDTAYGRTKLEAERAICSTADESFAVTILRPPMVIGEGAKGNYRRLERLAKRLPFCPDYANQRTLVRIETLCGDVLNLLETPRSGIFFPQEPEPVATRDLIDEAAAKYGRALKRSKLLNPAIRLLAKTTAAGRKAFGDLILKDLKELPLPVSAKRSEAAPAVSVIVPAYRAERTVEAAVRSALAQTVRDLEVIAVNDGSDDGTAAILDALCRSDERVRAVTLAKNGGVADARNAGVREARADWIAFLDSDDLWEPDKLEQQLALAERTGAELLYTGARCIDAAGRPNGRFFKVPKTVTYERALFGNDLVCSSVLIKKERFLRHPMERSDLHEDYLCWLAVLKEGVTAYGLEAPLIRYRIQKSSKSGSKCRSAAMMWRTYRHLGFGLMRRVRYFLGYCAHGIKRYGL